MTDLREAVARALFVHEEDEASWFDNPVFHEPRDLAMGRADAVLAALRDAGLAIVPKEPSGIMVLAGWDSIDKTAFRRAFYNTAIPRSFMEPILDAALSAGDLLGERGS